MSSAKSERHDGNGNIQKWLDRLNDSNHVYAVLFAASFLETIIIPIPIELVLIPFLLSNTDRLWRIATVVTAGCLTAALVGYGVGYWLFESVGSWLVETLGWSSGYEQFRNLFASYGFWAIVAIGIVPIPFQIAMLAAGLAGYSVWLFVLAATLARGIRYFGLAALVHAAGDRAEQFWNEHRAAAMVAVVGVVAALFGLTRLAGTFLPP